MLSHIKKIIKLVAFRFAEFFIHPSKTVINKSIVIIRTDAIGDYILFRNFIEEIKSNYKDYSLTLIGNEAWLPLAKQFEASFINRFISINPSKFSKNPLYRFKKMKECADTAYTILINPVFSRDFFVGDSIVRMINAKEKIGSTGDLSNISKWLKKLSDKYYSKLLTASPNLMFEFYRNKEFFENLIGKPSSIRKPEINITYTNPFNLSEKYAAIFIGASNPARKWSGHNFAKIAAFIKETCGYQIVVCGTVADIDISDEFSAYFSDEYTNLVGKTTLTKLIQVLAGCSLLVSNETSAPHFAAALGVNKIIVISNGNHFGRFIPYPKEICDSYVPVFHPEINPVNYAETCAKYGYGSKLNINDITPDTVIHKIKDMLNDK